MKDMFMKTIYYMNAKGLTRRQKIIKPIYWNKSIKNEIIETPIKGSFIIIILNHPTATQKDETHLLMAWWRNDSDEKSANWILPV